MLYFFGDLYYHRSLKELITFLALISTVSWLAVLFTTLMRFAMQASYKRKAKQLLREDA